MRSRLALGFLIVVGSCLAFSASASACQIANLVLSPRTAGPGDTVTYSISGIAPNATYTFIIGGLEVSGANDSAGGVDGTFTMPDLGSQEQAADANGTCSCPEDANSMGLHDSITYLPPPPASQPASPSPAASTPKQSVSSAEIAKPLKRHAHPRPLPSLALAKKAAKKQRHDSAATGSAVGSARADAVGSAPLPSNPTAGFDAAKASSEKSAGVPSRVLDAIGSNTRVGPADVPTIGLLAIALILIAAGGFAAFVIYLWRNGPDPDAVLREPAPSGPDPVEEELQQIIAEGMARQLLSDLDLGEPVKVSSK